MADKKISELTGAGTLTGTEAVPIVKDGVTVKTTTQDIADLGGGGGSFDPTVDEVGTITPTNSPIDTGQSVQDGFSNAQGQIEDLYQRNPYQITQKFNLSPFPPENWTFNSEPNWDGTKVVFDAEYMDLITPYVNNPTTVSFDLWRETFDIVPDVQFRLRVSSNTGVTWTTLETYTDLELETFPQTFTVDLSAYSDQYELLFKFEKTDGSINAIYLDNFNLKYELPIAQFASDIANINFDLEAVLENEILESGLVWQVPNIDGSYASAAGSQYLRLANVPITQNVVLTGIFGLSCGVLSTTASAGGIAFIRRNDALQLQLYTNIETIRDFTVDSAITSGCRYFTGWSKNFQFSAPTNIQPDLQTECILVAKLSTSNNLQILHNDNTGTCTSIALGANFPANSNLYKYRVILQRISSSNYNIQVIRKTLSNGALLLSTNYNLTTNLPTAGALQQIHFITNNADAVDMNLGDYGLIVKKISL
jgi:hypothetical protein